MPNDKKVPNYSTTNFKYHNRGRYAMKQRFYPWIVFVVLVIFVVFMSAQGKSLEAVNIWVLIGTLVVVILGLLFGVLRKK